MNDGTWTRRVHFPVQVPSRDVLQLIALVTFRSNLLCPSSGLCCQNGNSRGHLNVDTLLSDFAEDSKPTKKAKFENSVLLVTGQRSFDGASCRVRSVLDPTAQHFCSLEYRLTDCVCVCVLTAAQTEQLAVGYALHCQ